MAWQIGIFRQGGFHQLPENEMAKPLIMSVASITEHIKQLLIEHILSTGRYPERIEIGLDAYNELVRQTQMSTLIGLPYSLAHSREQHFLAVPDDCDYRCNFLLHDHHVKAYFLSRLTNTPWFKPGYDWLSPWGHSTAYPLAAAAQSGSAT